MQIFVKCPKNGECLPLNVAPESSVQETRRRIGDRLNIPQTVVRLVFGGKVLEDDKLLTANGVRSGCVINLQLPPDFDPEPQSGFFGVRGFGGGSACMSCGVAEVAPLSEIIRDSQNFPQSLSRPQVIRGIGLSQGNISDAIGLAHSDLPVTPYDDTQFAGLGSTIAAGLGNALGGARCREGSARSISAMRARSGPVAALTGVATAQEPSKGAPLIAGVGRRSSPYRIRRLSGGVCKPREPDPIDSHQQEGDEEVRFSDDLLGIPQRDVVTCRPLPSSTAELGGTRAKYWV